MSEAIIRSDGILSGSIVSEGILRGSFVRGITTGTPTEVYTFDQRRDEVKRFLQNVIYDPSDYTTSQIQNYVTTPSTDRPVGATITVKSAGMLTVVDGYTGNSVTKNVDAGRSVEVCAVGR